MNIDRLTALYKRYKLHFGLAAAFLLPLKLLLAFLALIPLVTFWLVVNRERLLSLCFDRRSSVSALFTFIAVSAVTAVFGLSPLPSIWMLVRVAFFACAVLVFREIAREAGPRPLLGALVTGQTIAALHSAVQGAFPSMPGWFLGKVTESGQLSLSLVVAAALLVMEFPRTRTTVKESAHAIAVLAVSLVFAFSPLVGLEHLRILLGVLLAALLGLAIVPALRAAIPLPQRAHYLLATVALPLLTTALAVNLKRGPWFGVLVALVLVGLVSARRVLALSLCVVVALVTLVAPVRERLLQSEQHFFIAGGRSSLWEIGGELSARFPLGIGYHNSGVLRQFSRQIPPELDHFHNNFLNVLVETGWLGLALYCWWLLAMLRPSLLRLPQTADERLTFGLGAAVLAWQCAGVVEYNFGDSEVVLVAYVVIGALTSLIEHRAFADERSAQPTLIPTAPAPTVH